MPVIELARALLTVAVGEVIAVRSDDPAASADIPAWCRMRGQGFEGAGDPDDAGVPTYRVKRLS